MFADAQASSLRVLFVTGLIAATSFTSFAAIPASPSQKTSPEQTAQIEQSYGKLPLSFEANTGQADQRVKFLTLGSGYRLYLTGNEAVLALRRPVSGAILSGLQRKLSPIQESISSDVFEMRLAGASRNAKPMGEEQLPGTASYFIGNDPAKWHTGVPTYAKVRYADIYPGIDLVYYGNQRQLEYDFVAASGADPQTIQLKFAGARKLRLSADGDLMVTAANGTLAFRKPLVYQIVDGHRQTVAGDFALLARRTVGFRLGSYDHTRALVIDPVLVYSTYLGGTGADTANAVTADAAGNAYVAGRTTPISFPTTSGAFQTAGNSAANAPETAFVIKLNPAGTALVYSTYLGGSGGDSASGLAVDSSGNAYVTGSTSSTDFPVTQGAFQTTNKAKANGNSNAFVTKLNPTGTALVYSTYLGGSGSVDLYGAPFGDQGTGLAVDSSGNAYVTGETVSSDFPVTQGAFKTTSPGQAAFVTKLNPAGTALVYSTYLGAIGDKSGAGYTVALALDGSGNAYIAGATSSANFPVTPGAYQQTNNAAANKFNNAFVTKLNPSGSALVFSTFLGGNGGGCCAGDLASGVALDSSGAVYVTGSTQSTDFPVTTGAFQATNHNTNASSSNAFVTKLNSTGTALVYSTYLGGSGGVLNLSPTLGMLGGDQATGLAIDGSGDAFVTGSTASVNFPVTSGAYQTTNDDQGPCPGGCIGGYNAFITELNPAGSALVYSTYLGGNGINPYDEIGLIVFGEGDQASALALDNSGNVYLAGSASSGDFPVTGGAFQTTIPSSGSAFVSKLTLGATSTATTPTVTVTSAPTTIASAQPLTVTVALSGDPTPTGTVTLASGTYASGAFTLTDGSATIDVPAGSLLAEPAKYPSPDVLTANYVPDAASSSAYNFSSGVGSVYVIAPYITVTPAATTLTLTQAQAQSLSVLIAASSVVGLPTPTGTVILVAGNYASAPATLTGGQATITIPAGTLTAGYDQVVADYAGDSNYFPYQGSNLITVTPIGNDLFFWIDTWPIAIAAGATTGNTADVLILPKSNDVTGTVTLACTVIATPSNATSPVTCNIPSSVNVTAETGGANAALTVISTAATAAGDYVVEVTGTWGSVSEVGVVDVTVTAVSAQAGFAITNSGNITVNPGATTGNTSTISVTPSNGFTGTVNLSCVVTTSLSNPVFPPACSIPSSVAITGAAAATATLTITTTASQSPACGSVSRMQRGVPWYAGGGAVLACVMVFGIPARRRSWLAMLGILLLVAFGSGVLACGHSSTTVCNALSISGTTAGTYTVTVTGTSGATTATDAVTLTVQ
jgi:hypothetical protein